MLTPGWVHDDLSRIPTPTILLKQKKELFSIQKAKILLLYR